MFFTPKRYQGPVLWARLEMFFTPKRYQDPVLWARLEIFSPQEITRGTNSKATHNLISYFYGSIPQTYVKASTTVDRVGLNTLKGTENRFFNP